MEEIIGIDVSKDKLDIAFLCTGEHFVIKNNKSEINKFIKKTHKMGIEIIVMEATGGYEKLAFRLFSADNQPVHIASPNKVFHFAKGKGRTAKTDKIDAKILAQYGDENELSLSIYNAFEEKLHDISARIVQLKGELTREKCRNSLQKDIEIKRSLKRIIKVLDNEILLLNKKLSDLIDADNNLKNKKKILMSCKGIGEVAANMLICQMPELGKINGKEAGALAGLAPMNNDSGKKQGRRRIHGGRSHVKKVLYLCSLSAVRYNEKSKLMYNKLIDAGKMPKVALIAVARKLLVTLNAMLRDAKKWDGNFQHQYKH